MNLFFDIPKVLQIDVLARWLETVDAANLDSATTSHRKFHHELLGLLKSPECILGFIDFASEGAFDWVILRKVKLLKVCVSCKFMCDEASQAAIVQTIGATLQSLNINNVRCNSCYEAKTARSAAQLLIELSHHCRGLATLRFRDMALDATALALISAFQNSLANVCVTRCLGISTEFMHRIYQIPGLKKVEITGCSGIANLIAFSTVANTSCTSLIMLENVFINLPNVRIATLLPNLRVLVLSLGQNEDLLQIAAHCPLVEHAHIVLAHSLSYEHASFVAQKWQHIRELHLLMTHVGFVADALAPLIDRCLSLEYLTFLPFEAVTTTFRHAQINAPGSMSHLQELTVGRLHRDTLREIVEKCPYLHTLCIYCEDFRHVNPTIPHKESPLASLHLLNNSSIKTLCMTKCMNVLTEDLVKLRTIEKLVLRSVGTRDSLSVQGIVEFVQQCPTLHTLHIHNCPGIDHTVVLKVLRVATQLRDFAFTAYHNHAACPALSMVKFLVMVMYPQLHSFQIVC